jgi:D-3-phosphoglycerate dehydrogenase
MARIVVATEKPFAPEAINLIRDVASAEGHEIELVESYPDKGSLKEGVKQAEALIIRSDKIDGEIMDAAPALKIIVRAGAGYDNVDLQAASDRGICVMNTPGQNANAVAELVIGFMIFQSRNQFNGKAGTEIKGKKLGIVGFGNIGKLVARAAKGMGMETMAYDAYIPADVMEKEGVQVAGSIEEIFAGCQYVSLHIPAVSDTKGAVDYHLLNTMPKGAMLINTARQEVVNEQDLVKMLEERKDFTFVSDFPPKEVGLNDPAFGGRWFAPPKKMGAQTAEANINAGVAAARQIAGFFANGDTTFQVNK